MENLKGSENINGLMGNFTKANGSVASSMDRECGMEPKEIAM
jgi:hypothetical protein